MKKQFYSQSDYPDSSEKNELWQNIRSQLPSQNKASVLFHWKSFWIGNAAALLLIFAVIGMYETGHKFFTPPPSEDEQVYQGLNSATRQLENVAPILIQQASEQNKTSMESTFSAIREIDRLIEELKNEMLINGITPSKQSNLKRLYATKLDFYKELLLTNRGQS